jgi:uncharacterized protein
MRLSEAIVNTKSAESYMRKFGQHWSHKCPVAFDEKNGCKIELRSGTCDLLADSQHLEIRLTVPVDADQGRLEQVIEDHLKRFAFREALSFAWTRSEG